MRFQDNNDDFSGAHGLWRSFAKQGRIEDYLRYRGIDIYTNNSDLASYLQAKKSAVTPQLTSDEREIREDGNQGACDKRE